MCFFISDREILYDSKFNDLICPVQPLLILSYYCLSFYNCYKWVLIILCFSSTKMTPIKLMCHAWMRNPLVPLLYFHIQQYYVLTCMTYWMLHVSMLLGRTTGLHLPTVQFILLAASSNQYIFIHLPFQHKLKHASTMAKYCPKSKRPNSTAKSSGQVMSLTPATSSTLSTAHHTIHLLIEALHIIPTIPLQEVKKNSLMLVLLSSPLQTWMMMKTVLLPVPSGEEMLQFHQPRH